jgi:TrmH family RNA methyltransferase
MISKNTIKLIKSLDLKKIRTKEKIFVVEGDKNVSEVLYSKFNIEKLFATNSFLANNKTLIKNANQVIEVTNEEIKQASLLKSPQNCIALCTMSEPAALPKKIDANLSVYLDDIQDPGNLGTIIRICDWFGIEHLFCSPKTADLFNPKVIQASMGSFCRVEVCYTSFEPIARLASMSGVPVYGAFLDGKNIYEQKLPQKALLVLGNEGNGISAEIENVIDRRIKIPEFNRDSKSAESLNVSVATAILCSEFMRQNYFSGLFEMKG